MNPATEDTKNRQTIKRNVVSLTFLFWTDFQPSFCFIASSIFKELLLNNFMPSPKILLKPSPLPEKRKQREKNNQRSLILHPLSAALLKKNASRQKRWQAPAIVSATTVTMRFLITLTILITCLSAPSLMQAMEIKQMMYTFNMDTALDLTCETFVTSESPAPQITVPNPCRIPAVYFQLNSAILSTNEANSILSGIEKCQITQSSPLIITGFTCDLGPDQFNQTLSLQRAKTVADLLRIHGLTVAIVQGKGSQNPISSDRQYLFKNRRVEIETCQPKQQIRPQASE